MALEIEYHYSLHVLLYICVFPLAMKLMFKVFNPRTWEELLKIFHVTFDAP